MKNDKCTTLVTVNSRHPVSAGNFGRSLPGVCATHAARMMASKPERVWRRQRMKLFCLSDLQRTFIQTRRTSSADPTDNVCELVRTRIVHVMYARHWPEGCGK